MYTGSATCIFTSLRVAVTHVLNYSDTAALNIRPFMVTVPVVLGHTFLQFAPDMV